MDTLAMLNNLFAKGPDGKRPRVRLTTDERNARASARQVRRFLSGRVTHDVGYLKLETVQNSAYYVTTWTGEKLLMIDRLTKARTNAFGRTSVQRYYFSGTDARGRRWHGVSPGDGMFARIHINKGRKPRKRPPSRVALYRALGRILVSVEGLPIAQSVPFNDARTLYLTVRSTLKESIR